MDDDAIGSTGTRSMSAHTMLAPYPGCSRPLRRSARPIVWCHGFPRPSRSSGRRSLTRSRRRRAPPLPPRASASSPRTDEHVEESTTPLPWGTPILSNPLFEGSKSTNPCEDSRGSTVTALSSVSVMIRIVQNFRSRSRGMGAMESSSIIADPRPRDPAVQEPSASKLRGPTSAALGGGYWGERGARSFTSRSPIRCSP